MSEETTIEPDVKQEVVTKDENNVPISRLNESLQVHSQQRKSYSSRVRVFELFC